MAKTKTSKKPLRDEELNNKGESDQQNATPKDGTASKRKKDQLEEDGNAYIQMPDVPEAPEQEKITNADVPEGPGNTTFASDDEEGIREGKDLLAEDDNVDIVMGTEADVTEEDLALLGDRDQDMDMNEDELVRKEGLDDTDLEGDPLNEAAVDEDSTGDDLDIPRSGDEDARKEIDDEENDYYSLGGGDKDALNEGRRDDEEK
ncbi:hypothetical protein [Niastella populi]|uniref:Uncharacterized protein n=1 Tax=Niastella populi TaxID=550983 RepID=A0A1V9GAA2_9BACT|nr:hypothetical protein [Niastella populi]OQP67595.1 hypothetical protein A4R26_12335 [Niastella populi]